MKANGRLTAGLASLLLAAAPSLCGAQQATTPLAVPDWDANVTGSDVWMLLVPQTAAPSTLFAGDSDSRPLLPVSPGIQMARTPTTAMLASAVLPGAGQALLGQNRWFAYAAVEVWAWLSYLDRRREASRLERRYKDLAASVARRIGAGARRDTVFEYYEALSNFDASGSFDADLSSEGIQPETDPSTFNGDVWRLARALFIPGGGNFPPSSFEYQLALSYYERHAVGSAFAWSWGDSRLERQQYNDLIHGSDEAYRDATFIFGALVANHLVSAVDAWVTGRLRASSGADLRFRSRIDFDPAGVRVGWLLRVSR